MYRYRLIIIVPVNVNRSSHECMSYLSICWLNLIDWNAIIATVVCMYTSKLYIYKEYRSIIMIIQIAQPLLYGTVIEHENLYYFLLFLVKTESGENSSYHFLLFYYNQTDNKISAKITPRYIQEKSTKKEFSSG